ncbi:ABC transporter permease [Phaeacidiphilus oryzae]|uniref:ABC transporter permease n=1 Tax=Phaeacidiphilus oryzae TaxID=348818 RepID=UPI00056CB928|nr:FtsX-like permease family protein [Phaeacidiphilus oryzae]
MFRTALRNVMAHKLRLLMTMLAVLLGVAFVGGTLVFTSTLDQGLRDSYAKNYTGLAVSVSADSTGTKAGPGGGRDAGNPLTTKATGIDQATYRKLAALPGVGSAEPTVSGFTAVADAKHDAIGSGWGTKGANWSPGADGQDSRYAFTSGHGPSGPGEIALDSKTAAKGGYHVGDTVDVSVDGPVLHEKLAGIFTTSDGAVKAGGTLTLFDDATAQKLFLAPGLYDRVDLKSSAGQQQLLSEVDPVIAGKPGLSAETGQKLVDDQAKAISSSMSTMNTVFLCFAGVALFVGIFLIANTFTMLVAQRTRELALLRAVGASRRQVTRSVLFEAVLVGLLSSVAGYAVGIGLAIGMRSVINATSGGSLPDNAPVITVGSAAVSLVIGVLITVLSAWLPARRAAKIPPVAAMSSVDAPPKQRSLIVRNTLGLVVACGGGALIALGLASHSWSTNRQAATVGAGAALLLVGLIVLTPLVSRPVIGFFTPLLAAFGVSGRLAKRNSLRNPRRTAATATALMIGLTLMSAMGVVTTSLKSGIASAATDGIRADYEISNGNFRPLDGSVVAAVKKVPGVQAATGQSSVPAAIGGHTVRTTAMDTSVFTQLFNVTTVSGSISGLRSDQIAVDQKVATRNHWTQGERLPITLPDKTVKAVEVAGVYPHQTMSPDVYADNSLFKGHVFRNTVDSVTVRAAPGKAGSQLQSAIKAALGDSPVIQVQTKSDLLNSFDATIDRILYMVYGLLGMSVIVAVIGVVNTMAMSVFERAREIGMLRAIGLDRRRVKRMVRLESLVIAVFGALLGLSAGTFLAWACGRMITPHFSTYQMVLPWSQYAVFGVAALVVGVVAAMWPARRAARLNALQAIKTD